MSATTASAPKTSKAKTSKASSTKKPVAKKPTAHPSWKTIISECITVHKEEARAGVSRQLLKKFAAEKYKLAPTAANIAHLNHAITHGAEKGIFLLPKGPSGRVKLSVAGKASRASDEVSCLCSPPAFLTRFRLEHQTFPEVICEIDQSCRQGIKT
ncbi:hypothetical protein PILCRDRAFT_520004 [Piloderma croceum F 1598]|uniref:Histone H1 n=1 Tax=Piloderma croceum (strain F 1598) TaxID=765440 RepID=A0A0C3FM38_PILCF|nr:hypothetical protein PILCRDRAFT_520004 [Piloderma croceum F 1598]